MPDQKLTAVVYDLAARVTAIEEELRLLRQFVTTLDVAQGLEREMIRDLQHGDHRIIDVLQEVTLGLQTQCARLDDALGIEERRQRPRLSIVPH